MAHMKKIIGWTAIALFAATLAGIWVLTEQNAVQTSLLSESTARVVEGQAASVQATGITGEIQAGDGMTESTNPAASTVQPGRLASIRMWVGANVRRVAPYRRVFLRRIVRLGDRGLLFQASMECVFPLRACVSLLRCLLRWRPGA
ncbi:MAG: hypothetical protein UFF97_07360 [Collinsella sp.]|nr:hypothetical protein [Collinsella sp.]